MRNLNIDLENRKINYKLLEDYGFHKTKEYYIYEKNIYNNEFKMIITVEEKQVLSKLVDLNNDEEYLLVDINNLSGEFVGSVRSEYEKNINDFVQNCSIIEVFKNPQSKEIINYIKNKYDDELEYLWKNFSDNAIWRNKKNNKWYGILLIIKESKLGNKSDKLIEVLDLRCSDVNNIGDNKNYFKGYHMNKNSWITIKMDNTVSSDIIYKLIDESYNISLKK